ncbi:MAG: hypothetical protein Q4D14_03565 [Bacteroidales bacterium]|nr:hypothetical protein [Bacteroidales bacterium]
MKVSLFLAIATMTIAFTACGNKNKEAVDLGLSVKWATCNVGASSPEDYGDYFAWGETSTKSTYDWESYKYCNGKPYMTKYCTDSNYGTVDNRKKLEPSDDVAHVKWGGDWRMPTAEECEELKDKCKWEWKQRNGVNGYKVTGPNGNSIFLPAAGCRSDGSLYNVGSDGNYWSSSLYSSGCGYAWDLWFDSSNVDVDDVDRGNGQSVRPVCP